ELTRQLDVVYTKQSAVLDRAAIIIAADVVLSVLAVSQTTTAWLFLSIGLSVISGLFALRAIRYWKSKGSRLTDEKISKNLQADPYSVGAGLVRGRGNELAAATADLGRKQWNARIATWALVAAWAAALTVGGVHYFDQQQDHQKGDTHMGHDKPVAWDPTPDVETPSMTVDMLTLGAEPSSFGITVAEARKER
uniref:hypothetical protein n=1 Tax=Brevibacterium sediminis TaxID=1857024 RepID=UPI003B3A2265